MKQLFLRIIKFICSSLLSFVIDIALYKLLVGPFGDVLANICARVVSASFNFTMNRRVVFEGDEDTLPAILKYVALAACVLLVNTLLLHYLFIGTFHMDEFLAKIITECTVFLINFPIQGKFVFKKKNKG
ncbi:MAG: GtrA family protein [Clostridia bacterium]|nr:GtrA family protein [Clostridia bacterium]MBQ5771621.1 GtrA family protein [Clostridia bacterium]